jgi:hypothetical protein
MAGLLVTDLPALGARVELIELDPEQHPHLPHQRPLQGIVCGFGTMLMVRNPNGARGYHPAHSLPLPTAMLLVWWDRDIEPAAHDMPAMVIATTVVHPDNVKEIDR